MLNLLELEQLVTFADCGTLSKAAEELHISQPTITRTMQNIETAFGVPLFLRNKNKIKLNETGVRAVEYARSLLASAQNAVQQVQLFHTKLHTVSIESCAPAPLWSLLPLLSQQFPEQTVSTKLFEQTAIVENVTAGICEIGILPYPVTVEGLDCIPIIREHLSAGISRRHELADRKSLTFEDLNGYNCLLRSQIGFWTELCYRKMPASKFLVQTDDFAFQELIRTSTLPCFTTNLATGMSDVLGERNIIPITSAEADVIYYFVCKKNHDKYLAIAEQLGVKEHVIHDIPTRTGHFKA